MKLLRISLDSNVFADQDFIDWLQDCNKDFEIFLSVISALETYHWYNLRGISKELFNKDIQGLNAILLDLTSEEIYKISALTKKSNLRFKHHARDFIIGTQALIDKAILITSNHRHFDWMGKENVLSPDSLVTKVEKSSTKK